MRGDNPWNEHIKWYPHCAYTKQFHRSHSEGYRSDHASPHSSQQDSDSDQAQQGHITDLNTSDDKAVVATAVTRMATGLKSAKSTKSGKKLLNSSI